MNGYKVKRGRCFGPDGRFAPKTACGLRGTPTAGLAGGGRYGATYHRDGTVTLWNVYTRQWERGRAFSDDVLASLSAKERARVLRHIGGQRPLDGAHEVNNLVLYVENEGALYARKLAVIRKLAQLYAKHGRLDNALAARLTRPLVDEVARTATRDYGERFSAADKSAAALELAERWGQQAMQGEAY
jgi:hypothetical protein